MQYYLMKTALFLARLLSLYSFLIWVRIFISWIVPYPRPGSFTYYLGRIIDPYLSLFRTDKARIGVLDFSPIIAVGILAVFQSVLQVYGAYGYLTFGYILAVVIQMIWSYGISLFLWISIFSLIFSTIASFSRNPVMYNMAANMNAMPHLKEAVRRCFGARIVRESTVNVITLIITFLMLFVAKNIVAVLCSLALRIPF